MLRDTLTCKAIVMPESKRSFIGKWRTATRVLAAVICLYALDVAADDDQQLLQSFDGRVAPILAGRCLECHSGAEPKAGLNLSFGKQALAGGESGRAIQPGRPDESLLWQYIRDDEMPPNESLTIEEKETLREWIAGGAKWGTDPVDPFRYTTRKRAGYDWWALQPVKCPEIPDVVNSDRVRNAIDAFVLRGLEQNGLSLSPEADRRTLIRRLSFDLLGLPPTPAELNAFLQDSSPEAYEELVNRMLDSRHYGERWARHWLDVARFGESQGFERDKLRPNAWRYRDWVIQALNDDMPYDEFARLQLAGDVLEPNDHAAITATGFLVAGPYDEVGQSQQSAAMKAVVRQDELEDIVGTVGQTFLGLTVNCSRCHDHKFDPIRQKEYYQLTAALGGVRHGERSIRIPEEQHQLQQLESQLAGVSGRLKALDAKVTAQVLQERETATTAAPRAPEPMARWDFSIDLRDSIGSLHGSSHGSAKVVDGGLLVDGKKAYVSSVPITTDIREKTLEAWVRLSDLEQRGGGVVSLQKLNGGTFDAIVFGEREPARWMAGSNGFVRTHSFDGSAETEAKDRLVHLAVVYAADGTITGYRDGVRYGQPYKSKGPVTFRALDAQVLFGLRHGTTAGGNRNLAGVIDQVQLYDRALTPSEVAASAGRANFVDLRTILARLTRNEREQRTTWETEINRLENRIKSIRETKVYAVTPRPPGPAYLLIRGNSASKGESVEPDGIAAIRGLSADFQLPGDAPDANRRRRLAAWIADEHNPLFSRVMVNRVWHHHFGTGLVDTPNDFGFNGGKPSHPELIDWLASELIDSGWSLKALHRLIVTSATWRQSSLFREEAAAIDAGNRLLWRKQSVRLDAESLRDALLRVSGELNAQFGGPPFQDFRTYANNSQFYEMLDPVGFEFNRRTIYRTWIRSGRNRFLDAFDCPDPSTTAPRRAVTTTPIQSLALWNNSFVLRMADRLANRVTKAVGDDVRKQTSLAIELAYTRPASDDDLTTGTVFVRQHGLSALCRVILNSNEFLHVD